MAAPRPYRIAPDGLLTVLAVVAATLPVWRMGWLRDDWFLLWAAVDPATAPAAAGGVFPRPVAAVLWHASAALGGDAPWAMHLLTTLAWIALAAGLLRWHRAFGGGTAGAVVTLAALMLHGSLVEPRLWAAAGNGVLAAALGAWGAWLVRRTAAPVRAALGGLLMLAAVLARADAVLLLLLPLAASPREGGARGRDLLLLAAAGAIALFMMRLYGGHWTLHLDGGGRLLRLVVLPWGPPLPTALAKFVGALGLVLTLGAGRLLMTAAPRTAAALLAAGGVAAAGAVIDWTPAGRYVLVPVATLALALGSWWEGVDRTAWARPWRHAVRAGVVAWLAVSALAAFAGNTAADLQQRSAAETGLYRALRAEPILPGDHLTVLNPPPLGWTDSAADLENIASFAWRRTVGVTVGAGDDHSASFPVAVWRHGQWIVWTGQVQGAGRRAP